MLKKISVGIIGLGYVGLPILQLFSKKKIDCFGFDVDYTKVRSIKKNISYISDLSNKSLKIIKKNQIFSMDEIKNIKKVDYIIFCLPTPLKNQNAPDMSILKNAFNRTRKFLKKNQTIILESTVYPGATRDIFLSYLNRRFTLGKNFFLCYSSERISPGQTNKKIFKFFLHNTTKVISGFDKNSIAKIKFLYNKVFEKLFLAKSIEIAEMSKLLENSYRSVNIGLINEIKMLCHRGNINFHDVISAASSKPFGFNAFSPGPGVGGHCIPIDPIFLNWYANKIKGKADLITIARKKNLDVTKFVNKNILRLLKKINSKKEKKILIIGVAYKKDINDYRESPSLKIINNFIKKKIKFDYYDPYIDSIKLFNKKIKSIKNLNRISSYDIVTLVTDHTNLPYKKILSKSKILIDTRGYYAKYKNKNIIFL